MNKAILALAVAGLALSAQAQPWSFTAKVIHVSDGDTVVALDSTMKKIKVRLANIDAPESGHGTCRPGQPWSSQSTAFMSRLIKGRTVQFQCSQLDRYDRSICDILVDNTTANRALVAAGLAWANRAHPSYLQDPGVAQAEKDAASSRRGLWQDPAPIAPWEWRKTIWNSPTLPSCNSSRG